MESLSTFLANGVAFKVSSEWSRFIRVGAARVLHKSMRVLRDMQVLRARAAIVNRDNKMGRDIKSRWKKTVAI